ncbi:FAD-dependent oxidoreductase [Acidimangrovimonas sediminis]|uniref:FAD-dependent oxidoreductase n=1 Tax=Acidimangrovimonas sediminis TaxID=2056283 RepID=UPI000C7FC844|nr:FAD-dependent oxidoreductase [Acidimangrovimonas sediminis]
MHAARDTRPAHVAVLGAGPAGLTAAWELLRAGIRVTVVERRAALGGLGGTTAWEGKDGTYRFDFGGHRFITANRDLMQLVDDLLGDDLLTAERHSVIRFRGRTYDYPLSLGNLLRNAPPGLLAGAARDVLAMSLKRPEPGHDFASWTTAMFGPTLYRTFFAGYTQKLWGVPPEMLSADWAEQRISLMDLREVARLLLPGGGRGPRTYARRYRYPRHGFGVIFERLARRLEREGATLATGTRVTGLAEGEAGVCAVLTDRGPIPCDGVISTLPLPQMQEMAGGGPSGLRFRGLRFLNFPMRMENVSPYTWQYLSDDTLPATRLQEPRRRSPEMAPPGMTSLMLEIPCDPGQPLWSGDDHALMDRMKPGLAALGIDMRRWTGEVWGARAAQAYPLMTLGYAEDRARAFAHLARWPNLVQCGRQGVFRYIFTDTAMEMGQMAAAMLISGRDMRAQIHDHRNERNVIEAQSIA